MSRIYQQIIPGKKNIKRLLAKSIFWFLGRGIQAAAKFDPIVKKEIEPWDEGATIMLKINDFGPKILLRKKNNSLLFLGSKNIDDPDLAIFFKNIEGALLVLTGQLGIAQGFAEHRYTVKGDIGFSMSFVRILYIVESYLFPPIISKNILKAPPKRGSNSFTIYIGTLLGLR